MNLLLEKFNKFLNQEKSLCKTPGKIYLISNIINISLEKIENLLSDNTYENNEQIMQQVKSILVENLFKVIHKDEKISEDILYSYQFFNLLNFSIKNFDLKISPLKNLLEKFFKEILFERKFLITSQEDDNKKEMLKSYIYLSWDFYSYIENLSVEEIIEKYAFKIKELMLSNKAYKNVELENTELFLFVIMIVDKSFYVNYF